jgi:hypothetical protein
MYQTAAPFQVPAIIFFAVVPLSFLPALETTRKRTAGRASRGVSVAKYGRSRCTRKVEYDRPGIPAGDRKYKRNNNPLGDKTHSSKDGESDTKQESKKPHENLLSAVEEPALAQQKSSFR